MEANKRIDAINVCESIANTSEKDTNRLAAHLWELGVGYMDDVRARASRSFVWALVIAILGIGFFFTALGAMMFGKLPFSRLALIAGMSIQVVSAIGFYLYGKTTKEFFAFHVCLERSNRLLLANTICENLSPPARDTVRSELVRLIAAAPPLSMSLVERGEPGYFSMETKPSSDESTDSSPEISNEALVKDVALKAIRN